MGAQSADGTPRRTLAAAVLVVAAAYFYFLLFAQFAFLKLAAAATGGPSRLPLILTVLGLGGIVGSLLAGWRFSARAYGRALVAGFAGCVAGALLALVQPLPAAAVTGLALGWLTVTLAAGLRGAVGVDRLGVCVGLGTGAAYALCNLPPVFTAAPDLQTLLAAAAAVAGGLAAGWLRVGVLPVSAAPDYQSRGRAAWLAIFLVLVWLDSTAFYVIQHTPLLRSAMWEQPGDLYGNAAVHFIVALLAGYALDAQWQGRSILLGFLLLAAACFSIGGGHRPWVGTELIYAAGVSIYSTALVYYPARGGSRWQAAALFAIAGWMGSGLGIILAQELTMLPLPFVLLTGLVVVGGLAWRQRWKKPEPFLR